MPGVWERRTISLPRKVVNTMAQALRPGIPEPKEFQTIEDLQSALLELERESFYLSGIRGDGFSLEDVAEECQRLGLSFCSDRFALLSMKIVAWEESFYQGIMVIPERVKRFNRFVLRNVAEELFTPVAQVQSLVLDGHYACVCSLRGADADYASALRSAAPVIERTMLDNCGVTVQLDASACVDGFLSLTEAYGQIRDIESDRRLLQDDRALLTWADISQEEPFVDYFDGTDRLMQLVNRGQYDKVIQGLLELTGRIFTGCGNYHSANFLFVRTAALIRELAETAVLRTPNVDWTGTDVSRLISECISVKELEDTTVLIFERLAEFGKDSAKVPRWFPRLMRLLQENYADSNINVATIADRLGISAPHLSRTFRKIEGIGLPEYIHVLRVTAAREYIQEGRSVKQTAELVGYSSQLTMIRAFKKYMGYTPGSVMLSSAGQESPEN